MTEQQHPVWVVMVQEGMEDRSATQIKPPAGSNQIFHVDFLRDTAKEKYGPVGVPSPSMWV